MENNSDRCMVILIFSKWPLKRIVETLVDNYSIKYEDVGVVRIVRRWVKPVNKPRRLVETDRTLLLVNRNEKLTRDLGKDLEGMKIVEYKLRDSDFPRKRYSRNFHIELEKDITETEVRSQIEGKLDILNKFGLMDGLKYRINIPMKSRESGDHKGRCFVTWNNDADVNKLALIRLLIDETRLYKNDDVYFLMKCTWAYDRKNRNNRNNNERNDRNRRRSPGKGVIPRPKLPPMTPTMPTTISPKTSISMDNQEKNNKE